MSTNPIGVPPAEVKACRFASCVQLFVDGELDPGRAMDVETHLSDCEPCAERAELLRSMKCSLRRACEGRAPESLRAKLSLVIASGGIARGVVAKETSLEASAEAMPAHDASGRESFLHGMRESRAHVRTNGPGGDADLGTRRSSRLAYGVGALALAAGVALAFLGERMSSGERVADGDRTSDDTDAPASLRQHEASSTGRGSVGRAAIGQGPFNQGPFNEGNQGSNGAIGGPELVQVAAPSAPTGPDLLPGAAGSETRTTFDAMLDDLAALHANPLPPETTNPDELRKFEPIVGVKLRRPTFRSYDARFRGARLHAMRDTQRAAMLQYIVRDDHRVTVYLFDPRAIPFGATRLQRRLVQEEPVYVGQFRGYSVAAAERRGIGYAVATDLDTDESVKMVAMAIP